jgi:hypothetical protein
MVWFLTQERCLDVLHILNKDFICEPQGKVIVKGKGEMDVWHIMGKEQ